MYINRFRRFHSLNATSPSSHISRELKDSITFSDMRVKAQVLWLRWLKSRLASDETNVSSVLPSFPASRLRAKTEHNRRRLLNKLPADRTTASSSLFFDHLLAIFFLQHRHETEQPCCTTTRPARFLSSGLDHIGVNAHRPALGGTPAKALVFVGVAHLPPTGQREGRIGITTRKQ